MNHDGLEGYDVFNKGGLPDAEAPLACTQAAHQKVKKLDNQFHS